MHSLPILADIAFSGYISLFKFLPFVVLFYLWLLLLNWVYFDTKAVQTDTSKWIAILTAAGIISNILWLFIPLFIVGFLAYLLIMLTTIMVYVMHRNALVADFEKVLTSSHIKGLFFNEAKKIEKAARGIEFVTANGNPVDIPEPKSRESYGFKIACELMDAAIWKRADIISIKPGEDEFSVSYTIDGLVQTADPIDSEQAPYFIHYIKLLSDLDTAEKRKPQQGNFKVKRNSDSVTWEVETAGTRSGEYVTLKREMSYKLMNMAQLGLDSDQIADIKTIKDLRQGLFLVAGAKSSGLTSCEYTLLRNHDPFLNSINTLEKKPAGDVGSIIQTIFNSADGMSYAEKLRSMLRRGPDIVGVFDCDDTETARSAAEAARKKLIYISIEAEDSIKGLTKWIKLVGDKDLALENLVGIASSHLVRKLCDECKEEYIPNPDTLRKLNIPDGTVKSLWRPGEIEYTRSGKPILCENCQGQGYYGRTGVYETFIVNEKVRKELIDSKSIKELSANLKRNGMQFFRERLTSKISDGSTSLNEMIRVLKVLNG
ncbi:MAG: GspE/PulE family protein [Phycisphaerae bacterium]|jgi:type IV pilus assembly protein PilB